MKTGYYILKWGVFCPVIMEDDGLVCIYTSNEQTSKDAALEVAAAYIAQRKEEKPLPIMVAYLKDENRFTVSVLFEDSVLICGSDFMFYKSTSTPMLFDTYEDAYNQGEIFLHWKC